MTTAQIYEAIRGAINGSPRKDYTAELHLQIIKYAEYLKKVTGKEFCEQVGISASYGTEFVKMRKIAERLRKAGLKPELV